MNYRIAIKTRRIMFASYQVILLVTILALLALVSACKARGEPSDKQIESARTAVATIRDTLYIPPDATLLAEKALYGTNPEFKPGCVRGFILMVYQSPRNFEQILTEYREVLKAAGWKLSPYHSHDQSDYDILIMGTQDYFEISDSPLRSDLLPVSTPSDSKQSYTIYYLQLSHYDPAILKCKGG